MLRFCVGRLFHGRCEDFVRTEFLVRAVVKITCGHISRFVGICEYFVLTDCCTADVKILCGQNFGCGHVLRLFNYVWTYFPGWWADVKRLCGKVAAGQM